MPCTGGGPSIEQERAERVLADATKDVTQKLCNICRGCEENDLPVPEGLVVWWAAHKEWDRMQGR